MKIRGHHMLYKYISLFFFMAIIGTKAQLIPPGAPIEEPNPQNWAMLRMFHDCMEDINRYSSAETLVEQLVAMWRYMENLPSDGDPISDRYVVTCYGGAVDMRHFLYTAIKVLTREDSQYWRGSPSSTIDDAWRSFCVSDDILAKSGERQLHIQKALYDSFCIEGGPLFEQLKVNKPAEWQMKIKQRYWQATVEDLPSSAMGALFAEHFLLDRKTVPDVVMEFTRFIIPFRPVPDDLRNEMSHDAFVKGFFQTSEPLSEEEEDKLFIHFTAVPVINTYLINKIAEEQGAEPFCKNFDDPKEALAEAGVRLAEVAYKYPLRLEYLKITESDALITDK